MRLNDNKITKKEIKIQHVLDKGLKNLGDNADKYTDVLCWNCCHKFANYPYFYPCKHDPKKKKYTIKGVFCSWECVKSYSNEEDRLGKNAGLLTKMIRDSEGKYTRIKPAPSKYLLKAFGGILDIEEFRNYHKDNDNISRTIRHLVGNMSPDPMVFEETVILKNYDESQEQTDEFTEENSNIKTSIVENWKLKRKKPLKNTKGTLESTMGLIVKK